MAYTGPGDDSLPENIKELPEDERARWVEIFNSVMKECQDEGGEDCESEAFKQANGVVLKKDQSDEEKSVIKKLWEGIKSLFEGMMEKPEEMMEESRDRAISITEVDSWDGSASNYADTDAYCDACLIDVNAAAGNAEKKQSHCMLPVKPSGSGSYADKAVHAAAGGHGITQVQKPDDVPQDAWDKAVKAAANNLISAYNAMDETAPDSVYEKAGKEPPETERAANIDDLLYGLYDQIMAKDQQAWVNGFFIEDSQIFAVVSSGGKLYRVNVSVKDDVGQIADEWVAVKHQFAEVGGTEGDEDGIQAASKDQRTLEAIKAWLGRPARSATTIIRQKDGIYRWVSVSCSAVLNRVGQIDSRELMDSFVSHIEETGEYPYRDFFHQGEGFRTGMVDFVARDDYMLVTSGVYDDSEIARMEIKARQAEPEAWGDSIEYLLTAEPELVEVMDGVQIAVYNQGILRAISTLPEEDAAALFTGDATITQEVKRMLSPKVMEAFIKLFDDDEDKAREWLDQNVESRNRTVEDDQLVARANEDVTAPEAETHAELQSQAQEVLITEIDEELIRSLTESLVKSPLLVKAADYEAAQEVVRVGLEKLVKKVDELGEQVAGLTRTEEDKQQEWLQDLGTRRQIKVTYRPRQKPEDGDEDKPEDGDAVAARVLKRIPQY